MSKTTWVLVANSSKARVLQAKNNQNLTEIDALIHTKSRLDGRDLASDGPGTTFNRVGGGRHAMEEPTDLKKQEAIVFARQVAGYLEKAFCNNGAHCLYLVATPAFLGLLRQALPSSVSSLILQEIPKDITAKGLEDIRKHLPYVL